MADETTKLIALKMRDGKFTVSPGVYLGPLFRPYLDLSRAGGATYHMGWKCGVLETPDAAADFIQMAENEGWLVVVDPSARDAMMARAENMRAVIAEAERYSQLIDGVLEGTGLQPFPYQRIGIGYLCTRQAAGLFDEMGLGKTVQALLAARALHIERGGSSRIVVICPKVAKGNWMRETARWWPNELSISVLRGRGSFRWPQADEVVITNRDILSDEVPPCPDGTIIIVDEAHAFKNPRALCSKRLNAITKAVLETEGGRFWLMTGTPLLNRPDELWNVLECAGLGTEAFGSKAQYSRMTDYGIDERVPMLLRKVSLLRRREEVLPDLPTKIYRDVEAECVQSDEELKQMCDEAWEALQAYCEKKGIDLDQAIEEVNTFAGGVAFEMISRVRHRLAIAKMKTLMELVEEHEDSEDPLVVFSRHRAPIDTLAVRGGWGVITGDQNAMRREETVQMFQEGRLRGIAATIQAGGVAITLTKAHEAIFVDLDWTPALNTQAEDRICRIGQTRGVIITRLIADHIMDQKVTEALDRKQALITAAVDKSARLVAAESEEQIALLEAIAKRENPKVVAVAARRPDRRPATNAREEWARQGLLRLEAFDSDRAAVQNGIGFNRYDNDFGHSLAEAIRRNGGELTERQWAAAVKMCFRYQRQIGACP